MKALQPYLDWANTCDDSGMTNRALQLRQRLAGWTADVSIRPRHRGFETFREWCRSEQHSVVLEPGDGMMKSNHPMISFREEDDSFIIWAKALGLLRSATPA